MAASSVDVMSAVTRVASLEEGVGVIVVPVASNTFAGAGAEDWDAGMSRLAVPSDLRSVPSTPISSWNDFLKVLDEIWQSMTPSDLIELATINFRVNRTILNAPDRFRDGLLVAYSDYIADQANGLVQVVRTIAVKLSTAAGCQTALLGASAAELRHAIFDADGSFDTELLLAQLVAHPDCELLRALIIALGEIREGWRWLVENGFPGIIEYAGAFATVLLEMLRDAKLQEKAASLANDAFRLGVFYGSLIGFVIWEIIEDVLMAGIGKGLRIVNIIL